MSSKTPNLILHHLTLSQSERIIFLLEELSLPYTLHVHPRNPETAFAPPIFKELHPAGTAPVLIDATESSSSPIVLAESAAIVNYIIQMYGGGRLAVTPAAGAAAFADYQAWFELANGTLQPTLGRLMMVRRLGPEVADSMMGQFVMKKLETTMSRIDERLKESRFLAGEEFTAADIMSVFTLSTMRGFAQVDFTQREGILRYLKEIGERDAYKRAMEKGDQGLTPMLGAKVEAFEFGKK